MVTLLTQLQVPKRRAIDAVNKIRLSRYDHFALLAAQGTWNLFETCRIYSISAQATYLPGPDTQNGPPNGAKADTSRNKGPTTACLAPFTLDGLFNDSRSERRSDSQEMAKVFGHSHLIPMADSNSDRVLPKLEIAA
jgi:hypothetical protein